MRHTARLLVTGLAAAIVAAQGLAACRWREDRVVWVERHDAAPDGDAGDGGCLGERVGLLHPEELRSLTEAGTRGLVIVDLRSLSLCQTQRIPGAQCVPFEDGALTAPIESLEAASHLVLYGQALEPAPFAAETLELACDQQLSVLADGFAGWLELGYPTEPEG